MYKSDQYCPFSSAFTDRFLVYTDNFSLKLMPLMCKINEMDNSCTCLEEKLFIMHILNCRLIENNLNKIQNKECIRKMYFSKC